MGISDTAANKFYNALTGKATWTTGNPWISLSTADGNDTGSTIAEFTTTTNGTGGRLQMANASWTTASASAATYNAELDWGAATGASSGNIIACAFWNASTGTASAQFEGWTTMSVDKAIADTNVVKVLTGLIDVDLKTGTAGINLMDAAVNKAVDAWTGKTTWTTADLYCGLVYAAPTDDAGTTMQEVTEVFPVDRIVMANASWATPASGSGLYTAIIDFGTATGATGANDILGYGFWTAASAGTFLGYQALTDGPVDIIAGDTYEIPANQITLDCQG